jgi:competence protein ComEC
MLLGGDEPEELARGDTLTVGGHLNLIMLLPDRRIAGGGNEESICLELSCDADGDREPETRMLLTGDAESPQLARLFTADTSAPSPSTVPARFDILKVGHHGSSGAVTVSQLGKMECRLALISAGRNNRYGHPSTETLSVLDEAGVSVYRTDLKGDIPLRCERGKVFVRCDTMTVESS